MPTSRTPPALDAASRGGRAGTSAQNLARKTNAQRAGRPGRICTLCGDAVHGGHKAAEQDARCPGRAWQWRQQAAGPFEEPPARQLRAALFGALDAADAALRAPDDAALARTALDAIAAVRLRVRRR